jgi:hypothetical protein
MNHHTPTEFPRDVVAILRQQYAYLAYRSMECFGQLAAGVSRDPPALDLEAKTLARTLKLLLRLGHVLPDYTQVLPASEALNALLFHCSICHREFYWPLLRQAVDCGFGGLQDPLGDAQETDWLSFAEGFARVVHEHGQANIPDSSEQFEQMSMQIDELFRMMRGEAMERTLDAVTCKQGGGNVFQ